MRPPIFLVDGDDVNMFLSPADATGYAEAVDVDAGVYSAYDSDGAPLRLAVDKASGDVILSELPEAPAQWMALRDALVKYLPAAGDTRSTIGAPLAQLVQRMLEIKRSARARKCHR